MARYEQAKETIIERRMFAKIHGVPLDGGPYKRGIPIWPCLCVTEPCDCPTLDDLIIWLPIDVSSERTGKQWEGNDIYSYQLDANSKVLVETQIPISIAHLQKVKDKVEGGGGGKIIARSVGEWLVGAFTLGWAIGEKIDEETGASDWLSDQLFDILGPWPPWD